MTESRTILVVEDNPLTRKMLRVTLETEGYTVLEAGDGRAALAAAEHAMPALVLQDLILPDMNGFELVRQLRELPGGTETPILALSGFLGQIEEARTAQAGFTALLLKPIEPSRLLESVKPYFPERPDDRARADPGHRLLLVDDDLVQLKLTRIRLEHFGFDVTPAATVVEALRVARAYPPDIVFADVLMPDFDGFQLCFEMRSDSLLAKIPVVLASAWYRSEADRELARRVGANALVLRTPDFKEALDALLLALKEGAPTLTEQPSVEVKLEHAKAVIRQLERQLAVSTDLARRCTLQAAQISLLGGVADALAQHADAGAALRDVLAATLDAAGISKGAIFLRNERGELTVRHAIGFSPSERAGLADLFGQLAFLQGVVDRQATVSVPSSVLPEAASRELLARADVATVQIVPLVTEGRGIGAMFLAARRTDITNEDAIAFARAMGNQLAQSLELAASFARLSASEQRYRTVTESANDAISILTPEGVVLEANRSLEQALGVPRSRIIGHSLRDFSAPGSEQANAEAYRRSLAGDGRTEPMPVRRGDDSIALMEFSNKLVEVAGERLVFSIGRDVTEQIQARAQLMTADRMVSVGTLAAGVAHEINNPLAALLANLEFATEHVSELALAQSDALTGLRDSLSDASEAGDRVRTIVRDLKIFSRAEEERRHSVDVERVMESSLRMAWNEIRHRAELVKAYEPVPRVLANESRLGQVFLNLVLNAAQAIPEGRADRNRVWIRIRKDALGRVSIEVEDTGPGIPKEVMPRLFTPFFTTKAAGIGTGLGLSICRRIVSELGGEITVESPPGKGALFRVSMPASTRDAPLPERAHVSHTPARRGRVLVLDDEPLVGETVRRVLSTEHEVVVLTNAKDALSRIAGGERFDVILCDLMMPVVTGMDFFETLRRESAENAERLVFLTAGAFTPQARQFLDQVENARLEKPFELARLRQVVNDRLR